MKVVRLSTLCTGRLYPPRKYFWYLFLLEAESTTGPQCGRKDYDTTGGLTSDHPACSKVSEPTVPPRAPHILVVDIKTDLKEMGWDDGLD